MIIDTPSAQAFLPSVDEACVVLVEDDEELREGLAENLRLHGLDVIEAECGSVFREAVKTSLIDVAIIDVNLPDANGFELARELAISTIRPGIILLTARTGSRDRRQGYADGADLYMTKPVDTEELLLAIWNLTRRVRDCQASRAYDGGEARWQLNMPRKLLVAPNDLVITLSGRETLLLEQFVKAQGQLIPRTKLSVMMGYGVPGPENRGLDAALHRLRDKAAKRNLDLPLLVVHAVGLRFAAPLCLA
ncbi:response regulator transcription factor [Telmatospirillum sp. J64-1]|uniref:response regulator transcription factor n=1 Tax=Telmatospirillum sp. J64-1 TaxID=2502183 RepID=UPI00115ECC3E|nr:response regulator transcription factor [Telmatospirillum sp. J64-1]